MHARNHSYLFVSLLTGILLTSSVSAADDIHRHFEMSAICGAGSDALLKTTHPHLSFIEHLILGTTLAAIPGVGKEFTDSNEMGNNFSKSDLYADLLGAFTGVLISNLLDTTVIIGIDGRRRESIVFSMTYPL